MYFAEIRIISKMQLDIYTKKELMQLKDYLSGEERWEEYDLVADVLVHLKVDSATQPFTSEEFNLIYE